MKVKSLTQMTKGWFVGNFEPSIFKTDAAEAAIKRYKSGDTEKSHCHKIATEVTVIISGKVVMNGKRYAEGDIVLIEPGEYTDFKSLTDSVTAVIKVPCAKNDKFEKI